MLPILHSIGFAMLAWTFAYTIMTIFLIIEAERQPTKKTVMFALIPAFAVFLITL